MTGDTIIELRNASKRYGGVPAVENISFDLKRGEVHGLVGENGAGKSTLTKMIAGVVLLSEGELWVEGSKVDISNPHEASKLGVAMVFQETSLVPTMTVAQNLYLGNEKFFNRLRGVYIAAQQFLQSLNFDVDPTHLVSQLGAAKKQMVEIARAVLQDAKVIIFDEPTATLTPEEKLHFFNLVDVLKARGVAIIFISHALEEALQISDRITVLRDGRHVITDITPALDHASIVRAMVGRDLKDSIYAEKKLVARKPGKRLLCVQDLRVAPVVRNTSFSVFSGQVTGVFGLIGSGRTETFKVVAGLIKRDFFHGGEIMLNDRPVRYRTPAAAVLDKVAYITEDRKLEGFFETMSIGRNIYMGTLATAHDKGVLTSKSVENTLGRKWVDRLSVRAISANAKIIELSGGNQQKVVIAKSLAQNPDLIIFDEPTHGVDVGAIDEIHQLINDLADEGKAVVVISSYLPEIMSLSDRILVCRQGKVVDEFDCAEATNDLIMYASVH